MSTSKKFAVKIHRRHQKVFEGRGDARIREQHDIVQGPHGPIIVRCFLGSAFPRSPPPSTNGHSRARRLSEILSHCPIVPQFQLIASDRAIPIHLEVH